MIKIINKLSNDLSKHNLENQNLRIEDFFYSELKGIYKAEKKLVDNLPKTPQHSSFKELQKTFSDYLQIKQQQITRLEKIVKLVRNKPFSTI